MEENLSSQIRREFTSIQEAFSKVPRINDLEAQINRIESSLDADIEFNSKGVITSDGTVLLSPGHLDENISLKKQVIAMLRSDLDRINQEPPQPEKLVVLHGLYRRIGKLDSGYANIQETIDAAIKEDRRITVAYEGSNDLIRSMIKDAKGCAITKPTPESQEITIWPPSQCTCLQHQQQKLILPTCLL